MRRVASLLLCASVVLRSGFASAEPTDADRANARALATQAIDALQSSHFEEAIDLVSRAEAILHAPTHLLILARAEVGANKLVAAQEAYLRVVREELAATAPAAFRSAQTSAKEELAALEPRIASLRVVAPGLTEKRATLTLDDVRVAPVLIGVFRPIDPGTHTLVVTPLGGAPAKTTVELKEGEKKEITLTVPDAPAPPEPVPGANPAPAPLPPALPPHVETPGSFTPLRIAGVAAGVVGVGLAVGGAVSLAKGFSTASTANANAAMLCTNGGTVCPNTGAVQTQVLANDDLAAKDKNIGIGLLVGGVALLGGGSALFALGGPKSSAPSGAPTGAPSGSGRFVEPYVTGSGVGLRGSF